jgi:beta-glucanase (GH16 family)
MLTAMFTACAPAPGPVRDSSYHLVFSDGFDGSAPNPDIWATAPYGSSLPPTVTNGVLTLKATAANDYMWGHIASTGPRSDTEPSYPRQRSWREGYFEARIRYTDSPWAWPAFWLFSMAKAEAWPDENCWFLNSEWDIMENGVQNSDGTRPANSWYFTSLHRNTKDGTADGYCGQSDTERGYGKDLTPKLSDWHVWAGLWTADGLCTYLDDVPVQCVEPFDSTSQAMHLTFTMQYLSECTGCPSRPNELAIQVDWVRVWQKSA